MLDKIIIGILKDSVGLTGYVNEAKRILGYGLSGSAVEAVGKGITKGLDGILEGVVAGVTIDQKSKIARKVGEKIAAQFQAAAALLPEYIALQAKVVELKHAAGGAIDQQALADARAAREIHRNKFCAELVKITTYLKLT